MEEKAIEAAVEGKQFKKLGKCRSKNKLDYPLDCGADADADQNGHGISSSREEKVSSLRTGLVHVAKKMPKNAHAHFILGLMYQRMGQADKAVMAYEKAAEILIRPEEEVDRPEFLKLVQIHHAQCILLGSLEDCRSEKELKPTELDDILTKITKSMNSDFRQASVWNSLGLILLKTGRMQSAISVLSALLAIEPDNMDCLGNLGIAYLQSGNLELAAKYFQDLVLKDQNHPSSLINYAAFLLCRHGSVIAGPGANADNGGDSAEQVEAANVAKECLLAAVKADPKAAHLWSNLANAYFLMSDHRNASKCLEKAAKLDPNCLATRYAVGVHRIRDAERSQNPGDQLSWAGNEMASMLREGDSTLIEPPIAWAGLAMVHKAQHEIAAGFDIENSELLEVKEHAIHSLKQAIAEDPDDAVQWHQLGLHSLCTQEFKTSQNYLKAAVARLKECGYSWSNLGISLQLTEDCSQAEEAYKRSLTLATSQQAHVTFSNLGNLYRQLRQYDRAKAMFTKSLELQPGYAPAYNNLGLVFVAEGRWEEAKFCFNKVIQTPLHASFKSITNDNSSSTTSSPDLKIRRGYSSYDAYIQHQLNKTLNPKLREIWTTRDWDRKVEVFSKFFERLKEKGFLSNGSRALCVGARVGQEVAALKRVGVNDSVGIDLVPYPPLVVKGDFHHQPFDDESFDFEFSNVFDHALYPWKFIGEIERTLRPGGVCVLHLLLSKRADKYSANDLYSVDPLVKLFERSKLMEVRTIDGFGLDTEVVFKKKMNSLV